MKRLLLILALLSVPSFAQTTATANPTSDESVTGSWTGSVGSRYTLVDDYADTVPTDVLDTPTAAGGAQITFGYTAFAIPTGSTAISVQVKYYDQDSTSGTNNSGGRLKVNGLYFNAATHNPSTTLTSRSDNWATNPNTTAAWTVGDINGTSASPLQAFGFNSTDASPLVRYSSVQIQVTYTPPLAGGWTKVQSVVASRAASIAATVTAGNLIVLYMDWETSPTTSVTVSDGTSSLVVKSLANNGNNELGQFAYLLSANGGAKTFTITPSLAASFSALILMEFAPPAGKTIAYDTEAVNTGSSTTPSSGNLTLTAGADSWLVLGGTGNFSGNAASAGLVNGAAAYELIGGTTDQGAAWYQVVTSTFTGPVACSITSAAWVANGISFSATTSGGGATVVPRHRGMVK